MHRVFSQSYFLFLFAITLCSCASNADDPFFAKEVKRLTIERNPNIQHIDTLYVLIDPITARSKSIFQSAECSRAAAEARAANSEDTTFFMNMAYKYSGQSEGLDDKTMLYTRVRTHLIFTNKYNRKGIGETEYYFDKKGKNVSMYSFVERVAKKDFEKLIILHYEPFTAEMRSSLLEMGAHEFVYRR